MDGLTSMQWMKICPLDGTALVPPPPEWRESQLEFDARMRFAKCQVCHKTARELFRLNEEQPSPTGSPARPAPPTAFQKSLRAEAKKIEADLQARANLLHRPSPEDQVSLRARYLKQRYAS